MEVLFSILLYTIVYIIVNVENAVSAALFLILLAVVLSMLLFYLNVNFLAVLYLAVYIGAVAVFFLFVVMMTDLNLPEKSANVTGWRAVLALLFGFFSSLFVTSLIEFRGVVDSKIDLFNSNIESIGFCMFNEHSGPFVIISLIILVALIGSIFITFSSEGGANNNNINFVKSQDMEIQLSRSVSTSVNLSF